LIKKLMIPSFVLIGFIAIYFLWPTAVELPNLGTIDDPELTAVNGEAYTFSTDKPKLVTFFYTECPDVCPMTIYDLTMLKQQLQEEDVGEEAYDLVLITLDPEVDTPEKIKNYAGQFNITGNNWNFLRGSQEQTRQTADQFNAVYQKDESGFITHSTTMYLLDEDNNIRAYHDMNTGNNAVDLDQLAENFLALLD